VTRRPPVTIVIVAYNRRDPLREVLRRMLVESDYADHTDVIVVDNASSDGTTAMVREEFPQVQVIERTTNIGAPAWNEGFRAARGDYVLILDDDCYLERDGLRRAVAAAEEHDAGMVTFKVISTVEPEYVFTERYRTGMFSFWGCSWLVRRDVLDELGGYDPEIFVWTNELEFTMRFYDHGFRHLHLPSVVGQHMKPPPRDPVEVWDEKDTRGYKMNTRHWGYIAGKLLRPRDAVECLIALSARVIRDGLRLSPVLIGGVWDTLRGFVHGLRHREPIGPELSRFYRHNFQSFASVWWLARRAPDLLLALPREAARAALGRDQRPEGIGRFQRFFAERAEFYPLEQTMLAEAGREGGGLTSRPVSVSEVEAAAAPPPS
jgi:glycosyltransferase involved in cell wall biosynthesis